MELITSFLCFSTALIFKMLGPVLVNGASQWGGYFEPVSWSLAPYLRGLDIAPWRDGKAHLFFWFLLLLLACHPEDEKLALAVHVSVSIPTSLQVIACFGSLWWDTTGLFYDCSFTFADLGGLPGWS